MESFLLKVKNGLPLLSSNWFNWIIGIIVFINPIAILPQLITACTAPSVAGISIFMFGIFAFIQLAFIAIGIQKLDWRMVGSMFISFLESISIIIIVLIRT